MEKSIINQIVETLGRSDGTFVMLPINGIVPTKERVNKRFTFIKANYLSVKMNGRIPTLYYYLSDGRGTCCWVCNNLKMNVLKHVLLFAKEYCKHKTH